MSSDHPIDPLKVYEGHKRDQRRRNRHPAQGYPPGATVERHAHNDELVPGAFVIRRPASDRTYSPMVRRRKYDPKNEFAIQEHNYREDEKQDSIKDAWAEYRESATWPRATEKINNTIRYKDKNHE